MLYQKGRGAQINTSNHFLNTAFEKDIEYDEYLRSQGKKHKKITTKVIRTYPKTIVNRVPSEDLNFDYSINPYQGCEHGCVYCYARNSHEYWGYSAGTDFESKILIKANAVSLLERKLESRNWKPAPIMLSGNTDCYQPLERKWELTRNLLKVFLQTRNPVGIITKNAMILRDLDILKPLAERNLIRVIISLTSLSEKTRSTLEPRTSAVPARLNAIRKLSEEGIPTGIMMAPIIPSINSHEINAIAKKAQDNGALSMYYTVLRLNGVLPEIFTNWLDHHYPDRKNKVLNQVKELHDGNLNDSRIGTRMTGDGELSQQIKKLINSARKKHNLNQLFPEWNLNDFRKPSVRQLGLF
ncbi:PA0069 family radical SAM protein [Reichenbachiella versicolor]|uniref:PA0069 family radical SAM protein n=1 Tax=Reichenbachiella versicolor TaxID=1821036 RepID=UPI000D6E66D6|nr:PA0069 family radical SAM protein [Reichenbachiella versicolor]